MGPEAPGINVPDKPFFSLHPLVQRLLIRYAMANPMMKRTTAATATAPQFVTVFVIVVGEGLVIVVGFRLVTVL